MADIDRYLVAQPSIDSLAFHSGRRTTRSTLSIAFDASSSRSLSADPEYGQNGGGTPATDREKDYRIPVPQTSYDPIILRDANFSDPTVVEWDGNEDPENPLYWPLRRKLWMSFVASLMAFAISLASSIFSVDVHVTAHEFDVGEEVMVLGVSLYVLGFACGREERTTHVNETIVTDVQQARFSLVQSASSTDDLAPWCLASCALPSFRYRSL